MSRANSDHPEQTNYYFLRDFDVFFFFHSGKLLTGVHPVSDQFCWYVSIKCFNICNNILPIPSKCKTLKQLHYVFLVILAITYDVEKGLISQKQTASVHFDLGILCSPTSNDI